MGAVEHIVVTGARGFLGRTIVRRALAQGHQVTAIMRTAPESDPGCTVLVHDLAQIEPDDLAGKLQGATAIIHAAGEMTSDSARHARSTLPATRVVAKAAQTLGAHLVHISSISVYDYRAIDEGGFVSETSPIEPDPQTRDGYVAAKIDQEALIGTHCPDATVLRVGALYGAGRVWNAHLGPTLGPVLLRLSARGQIPLSHVDTCAAIAVQAASLRKSGAINVTDLDLPTRTRFLSAVTKSGWPKLIVPLPWKALLTLGGLLAPWRGRPGLLRAGVLHARIKPVGFDTTRLERSFDVPPRSFEGQMKEALSHEP